MSRLTALWQEFWESVKWTGELSDKVKRIIGQMVVLLPLLGYSVEWSAWAVWLRPWLPYLFVPAAFALTWKVAVSWERTRGPVIAAILQPPYGGDTFHLKVRNAGGGAVRCRVFLAEVTDARGNRRSEITDPAEVYWSNTLEPMRLFGSKFGLAAILSVDQSMPSPKLRINTILKGDNGKPALGRLPVGDSEEIRLTFRLVFYSVAEAETELIDKDLCFAVIPSPTSPAKYLLRKCTVSRL